MRSIALRAARGGGHEHQAPPARARARGACVTSIVGIVITNGSVQADEQMYWYAAQALAKDGYIVMTFDPQGQGQSDTLGRAPDEQEGFPAQSDGRPFFDGTEEAINFFLSSPRHPYQPVPSCETGTSHAAKQNERVKKGLDAPYTVFFRPLAALQLVAEVVGAHMAKRFGPREDL
jgi:hypothetical protein